MSFMKKILLMHGANLNLLSRRAPEHYGSLTLMELEQLTARELARHHCAMVAYQSNHEGCLIDTLQTEAAQCAGLIINPGAFSHGSYALYDAILDSQLPTIEVHLSNLSQREAWRQHSVISPACVGVISGKKEHGYLEAVQTLLAYLNTQ